MYLALSSVLRLSPAALVAKERDELAKRLTGALSSVAETNQTARGVIVNLSGATLNSIAVTDKYVAIIDSLGSLYLWGKDGKFMGQAKEEALFGKGHTNNEIVNWDGNSIMAWNYNQKSDSNNKVQFDFYLITF